MRLGLLPSQQRALQQKSWKKARKFDQFRARTRRNFLALGLIGCAATVSSFFVGRSTSGSREPRLPAGLPEVAVQRARAWAAGPIDALAASYATFLVVFERVPDDPALIAGYARLAEFAMQHQDRTLARHLAESGAVLPETLHPLRAALQAAARGQ
ncbi:MAG TPA: hypothetical protein VK081_01280 [Planctomycetota bacterium]|nr:hypothetical protein [Planctomycetota bacterium]